MTDRNTEVTLDQLHDGIVAAIREKFPDMNVECYRDDMRALPVPSCLVEMTEMVAGTDPGTGQQNVVATFEALLVLGFRQAADKNVKLEIRRLAAAVAAFIRLQRWGCPVEPADLVGAYPSHFEPDLDQYEVWRVEWTQGVDLGETEWTAGDVPTTIMLGYAPRIGIPHVDDYIQVAP